MIKYAIRRLAVAAPMAVAVALSVAVVAQAKKPETFTVCKHGCRYATIQSAVNASGKNATIFVKPGGYVEGVIISGHKHDGLHVMAGPETRAGC